MEVARSTVAIKSTNFIACMWAVRFVLFCRQRRGSRCGKVVAPSCEQVPSRVSRISLPVITSRMSKVSENFRSLKRCIFFLFFMSPLFRRHFFQNIQSFPLTSLLPLCYHIRCTIVVLCVHSAVFNCGKAQFQPHYLVVGTDFFLGRKVPKC